MAVLGAGTIGLLLLRAVVSQGAKRVVVTAPRAERRELARKLGADGAVDAMAKDAVEQVRAALGESADVVFDCVAVQRTMDQAIAMALKGGTVVVVGVPSSDVTVPLPIVQDQQVRIQGSAMYLPEDYHHSMELLLAGVVRHEDIITGVYPLEQVAEAFAASTSGQHVKVVVTADGGI